jgi:RNA polymerase sigma factor (sigma-70 family)
MSSNESVTAWIGALKESGQTAAQLLYERYIEQLVSLARKKLGAAPRRMADEEDVAQVAMNSFFRGVQQGRFPRLRDRDDLWQVLIMLVERKAIDQIRRQSSKKREGIVGESVFGRPDLEASAVGGIEQIMGYEPSPQFAVEVAEEFDRRLQQLGDEELQQIALWKMEGRTNSEIAQELGCVPRTVERRLELIRNIWESGWLEKE